MKTKCIRFLTALLVLAQLLSMSAFAAEYSMGNFQKTASYTPFTDVPADAWYAEDVKTAVELGLMNGKGDGQFDPTGGLTLAEAVTLAVKLHSTCWGNTFTPGGTPWYQNAVAYGIEHRFMEPGEYIDYTQRATRADMVGIFVGAIPVVELDRINRISNIPDIYEDTRYGGYVYLLYNAGILTGDSSGAFHPDDGISRAEAAAIINRMALPANRRTFALKQSAPWGDIVAAKDGSFQINLPENWTHGEDEQYGFWCQAPSGAASLQILIDSTEDYPENDIWTNAMYYRNDIAAQYGEDSITSEPSFTIFRGLPAYTFQFHGTTSDGTWVGSTAYSVGNSTGNYFLTLNNQKDCPDEQWSQLLDVWFSFDLVL